MANLTALQALQLRTFGSFDVIGGSSGKRYRLWHCRQQNIEELDASGERVCLWCFHPTEDVPLGDVLLSQKMALELFEDEALAIAHSYTGFAAGYGPGSPAFRALDFEPLWRT